MINIVSRVDLLLIKNKKQAVLLFPEESYDFEWFQIVSEGCFATCRVKEIDLKSDNVVFSKREIIFIEKIKGIGCRSSKWKYGCDTRGIHEPNQYSSLIGQCISKVTLPSSLKWVGSLAWIWETWMIVFLN